MVDASRSKIGKALWKNATQSLLLKQKSAKEGYSNLDMRSLSEVFMS